MKKLTLSSFALLATAVAFAQTNWAVDPSHTNIRFSITHMVISETEGQFDKFDAIVASNQEDFNGAEVTFTAQVASVNTDNEKRDGHLKSDDFFNAEKYPEIKFKGKLVKKGSKYELVGDFTMRDVTKKVTFPVKYNGTITDPYGMTRAGFKITGTVNRMDYGLKWSAMTEAGGLVVGEDVEITCNVEITKKG